MILGALAEGGGQAWLVEQMSVSPAAFLTLIGKVLPLQVTGATGGALVIELVRYDGGQDSTAS